MPFCLQYRKEPVGPLPSSARGRQVAAPTGIEKPKQNLFLGGHALCLAPPGIKFYIFAVHLDGFIGAHPHIILLLSGQLADRLGSGLIFAYCHGLIALFEVRRCAVLHFIACRLGSLLFPGHLKAFFSSGHFRHAGALGLDNKSCGLRADIVAFESHLDRVLTHILTAGGIRHSVILAADLITLTVLYGYRRFLRLAVISVGGGRQGHRFGCVQCRSGSLATHGALTGDLAVGVLRCIRLNSGGHLVRMGVLGVPTCGIGIL